MKHPAGPPTPATPLRRVAATAATAATVATAAILATACSMPAQLSAYHASASSAGHRAKDANRYAADPRCDAVQRYLAAYDATRAKNDAVIDGDRVAANGATTLPDYHAAMQRLGDDLAAYRSGVLALPSPPDPPGGAADIAEVESRFADALSAMAQQARVQASAPNPQAEAAAFQAAVDRRSSALHDLDLRVDQLRAECG